MLSIKTQNLIYLILSGKVSKDSFNNTSESDFLDIFSFAKQHSLHITIYTILRSNKVQLPAEIENKMRLDYQRACSSDFKRQNQLLKIVKVLNENGIEHILLKGSHLIAEIYDKTFTRHMCDIDILVKKEDASIAYKILVESGYNSSLEEYDKVKGDHIHHYPPLYKENHLPVEMHVNIIDDYHVNMDGIWKRAQNIDFNGLKTKAMSNEDLIMHIAMHKLYQDEGADILLGLYDIYLILDKKKIDIDKLIELTSKNEYGNSKCIFIMLYLCQRMLNTNISNKLIDFLRPDTFNEELETTLKEMVFATISIDSIDAFFLGKRIKEFKKLNLKSLSNRVFMPKERRIVRMNFVYGKAQFNSKGLFSSYFSIARIISRRYIFTFFRSIFNNGELATSITHGKNCYKVKNWLSK